MAFVPLNTNNSNLANYNNVNNALRDLNNKKIKNSDLSTTPGEPGGEWESWTPTFTNLSGGTLNYAKYTLIGKTVNFKIKYTMAGANVAGSVTVTVPVDAATDYAGSAENREPLGNVIFRDAATAVFLGLIYFSGTTRTNFLIVANNASGTYLSATAISSTIPFTWAATDTLQISGTYEAA